MPSATAYVIILNDHQATHTDYETAASAWGRISSAVEDGRSIVAEFWRHTQHEWDDLFYRGLLDPTTGQIDASLFTVIPGKAIISRRCIASLIYA
jgi:hypothetical protein